jgi:hypothetical protein
MTKVTVATQVVLRSRFIKLKATVNNVLEASQARSDGTHNTHTYGEEIISPFCILESRLIGNWRLTIEPSNRYLKLWWCTPGLLLIS